MSERTDELRRIYEVRDLNESEMPELWGALGLAEQQVKNLEGKLECRESQLAFVAHRYRETRRELAVAEGEIDRLEAELAGYTEPISKVIQGPWT